MAMHPLEYAIGNIATSLAVLAVRPHLLTMAIYALVRIYQGITDHAGYHLPFEPLALLPFSSDAEFHDAHHSVNKGNFSECLTVWDHIMGTYLDPRRLRKRENWKKE